MTWWEALGAAFIALSSIAVTSWLITLAVIWITDDEKDRS